MYIYIYSKEEKAWCVVTTKLLFHQGFEIK